jgi:hypothetical protein
MKRLFLDDLRTLDNVEYMKYKISNYGVYKEEWDIVKNYKEFCQYIDTYKGNIEIISFDHDLDYTHYSNLPSNEKNGYDCALYLKTLYNNLKLELPEIIVHSMNPVGNDKIKQLFND